MLNSGSSHFGCPFPPPTSPSPPAFDTAAASAPPADPPIGASAIGYRTPNISVNAVGHAMIVSLTARPPPDGGPGASRDRIR